MDRFRLEYEMKSRNVSIEELCKVLGISRSAFYRKSRGISDFTQSEIQKISDYLHLESLEGIFFTSTVS